jgi:hypothetical protein
MWAVEGVVTTVVLLAIGVAAWLIFRPGAWWILLGIVIVAVVFVGAVLVAPWLRYRIHRWELTDDAVYTQRGLLTVEQRIAPISRVQTVDTERDLAARMFGLSAVTITTASAKGELRIEGLDRELADHLVQRLTAVTAASEGDAT